MSEAPKVEKSGEAPLPFNELDEIAWQKWINKHKERDAARRKKLIRIFWLASVLLVVGAVVWELTKST
jgi:hypothetical protein